MGKRSSRRMHPGDPRHPEAAASRRPSPPVPPESRGCRVWTWLGGGAGPPGWAGGIRPPLCLHEVLTGGGGGCWGQPAWPGCSPPSSWGCATAPSSPASAAWPGMQAAALIFLFLTALLCLAGSLLSLWLWRCKVVWKHPEVSRSGDSRGGPPPAPCPPRYSVGVVQPHTPPLPPEASASPSQARRLRGRGDAIGEILRKGPHCRGGQEAGGQVRPPGAGTPATCCPRLRSVSDSHGDGEGHRMGCHRTPGTPDTQPRGSCPPGLSLPHPEPRGLVAVQKVPGDPEPPAAGGLQGRLPGPAGGIHGAARGGPHRTAEAGGDGGGDGPAALARHEQDGGSLGGHRLWAPCVLRAALGAMSWAVSAGTGDEPGGGGGGDRRGRADTQDSAAERHEPCSKSSGSC